MSKIKDAKALFEKGCNCTQAMLAVYGAPLGLSHESAMKIGSAFGGGIAKTGETCGAVTAAVMLIGLKYGPVDLTDKQRRKHTYEHSGKFIEDFRKRNGSTLCRDLVGFDMGSSTQHGKKAIISRKCPTFLKDAIEILEEVLNT